MTNPKPRRDSSPERFAAHLDEFNRDTMAVHQQLRPQISDGRINERIASEVLLTLETLARAKDQTREEKRKKILRRDELEDVMLRKPSLRGEWPSTLHDAQAYNPVSTRSAPIPIPKRSKKSGNGPVRPSRSSPERAEGLPAKYADECRRDSKAATAEVSSPKNLSGATDVSYAAGHHDAQARSSPKQADDRDVDLEAGPCATSNYGTMSLFRAAKLNKARREEMETASWEVRAATVSFAIFMLLLINAVIVLMSGWALMIGNMA